MSVSATKAKLTGYTPGVTVNFQVRATKKGLISEPSNAATIYTATPPGSVVLKVA